MSELEKWDVASAVNVVPTCEATDAATACLSGDDFMRRMRDCLVALHLGDYSRLDQFAQLLAVDALRAHVDVLLGIAIELQGAARRHDQVEAAELIERCESEWVSVVARSL